MLLSNSPPSEIGRARLLRLYDIRSLDLTNVKLAITADNVSIAASKSTIARIELAKKQSQTALVAYHSTLKATRNYDTRFEHPFSHLAARPNLPAENDYLQMLHRINILVGMSSFSEGEQMHDLETRIAELTYLFTTLKSVLRDWQIELVLSEKSLENHIKSMQVTTSIMAEIRTLLSPVKLVPAEIWAAIFQRSCDLAAYSTGTLYPKSQIMILSHDCNAWKVIALASQDLWKNIEIAPVSWWPDSESIVIKDIIARAQGAPINLRIQLQFEREWEAQATTSTETGSLYIADENEKAKPSPSRYALSRQLVLPTRAKKVTNKMTTRRDLVRISHRTITQPYSLHICVDKGEPKEKQRVRLIPFKDPEALIIEAPSPRPSESLKGIISVFNRITRLVLVNVWPAIHSTTPTGLTSLRYLELNLHSFKPFDIVPFLPPTLEELHIKHSEPGTFHVGSVSINLPKLHTLAITLDEQILCLKLRMPVVRTLILRALAPRAEAALLFGVFGSETPFGQITSLSFHDWSDLERNPNAIEIASWIAAKARQLVHLAFHRCYLNCDGLLSRFDAARASRAPKDINVLQEVSFGSCTGITQVECGTVKQHVGRLNVYV